MPYLARYNPRLKRALFNLADSLREDREFIEDAKNPVEKKMRKTKNAIIMQLKDIVAQPVAIQKEVIRDALVRAGCNIKRLTFRHWKDIQLLIRAMPSGKSLDLPGRIRIKKAKGNVSFYKT
jgi:tRNA(Ile)-lysidine synthase